MKTLVISGPVGVGKTRVGLELSRLLRDKGICHSFVDFDALTSTYPRPESDIYGKQLGLRNLANIWPNLVAFGSKNVILAGVFDERDDIEFLYSVHERNSVTVCQLSASSQTLHNRIAQREKGGAFDWCCNRSDSLALSLKGAPKDVALNTDDLEPREIADILLKQISWVM